MPVLTLKKKDNEEVLAKVHSFISEGVDHCQGKHDRIEENNRYVRGEQWSAGDIQRQIMRERPTVPWNDIGKVVDAIANREIVERFVPKVFGMSDDDKGIANVLDEGCRWQRDKSESEQVESMAVRSMVVGGYGCMHKYWNPAAFNGDGQIQDEDIPVWQMLWPVRARQPNMTDRRWHIHGKWITVENAESQYGDTGPQARQYFKNYKAKKTIFPDTTVPLDGGYRRFGAFSWGEIRNGNWLSKAQDEIFVIEAEWIEPVITFKAAIPSRFFEWESFAMGQTPSISIETPDETGNMVPQDVPYEQYQQLSQDEQYGLMKMVLAATEIRTFDSRKELNLFIDRYFEITKEDFEDFRKVPKEIIKYAIMTDNMIWEYGERTFGFTYEFLTCYPNETRAGMDWYGVVDRAKGPQDYKNALLSNMLALYMASPKQPILIEEGALKDVNKFLDQLARPTAAAMVPDGFIGSNRYQLMEPPRFPPMSSDLLSLTTNAIDNMFGLSSIDTNTQGDLRRVSGNVVQAARTAGNTIMALPFDSIRRFRKRYGLLNVKFIQDRYSPEDIIRIVGEDKVDDIANVQNWGDVNKYDIKLDEEPVGITEQMDLIDYLTRTNMLQEWKAAGDLDFEGVLDLLPQIPESKKRKILERKNTNQELQSQIQNLQQEKATWESFLNMLGQMGTQVKEQWAVQQNMAQMLQSSPEEQGEPQQ